MTEQVLAPLLGFKVTCDPTLWAMAPRHLTSLNLVSLKVVTAWTESPVQVTHESPQAGGSASISPELEGTQCPPSHRL